MQQLFAQIYRELQDGATWWLTDEENAQLNHLNEAHKSVSVIEERVLNTLNPELEQSKWKCMGAAEVLKAVGYRTPTNPQARECGAVLRGLYGEPNKKINGIMKWKVPIDKSFVQID